MRNLLFIVISLILISIVLLGCNRQSNFPQTSIPEWEKPYLLNMLGININEEQYAGSYFEESNNESIYHINMVGDADRLQQDLKLDKVKIHSVNYSLKYLTEVKNVLSDNMSDLGISAIAINEKENNISIYIKDIDDNKLDSIKKVIDSPAIEVIEISDFVIVDQ